MIFLGMLAFVATAGVFVWAALKTSALREQEEERQRKAEQLIKGGSILK